MTSADPPPSQPPHSMRLRCSPRWMALRCQLEQHFPVTQFAGVKLLLAVSGGADSVAMLELVHETLRRDGEQPPQLLAVAHFNHAVRGQAADDDQQFVEHLAAKHGCSFFTAKSLHGSARRNEADFRQERYDFLETTMARTGARYLLVAHTADDNIETCLHHLFRGTGSAGLAGMARHRPLSADGVLYRPLLHCWRSEIREALTEASLVWREDHTNADNDFQRNWLRNSLLPLIRTRYPHADQALQRLIDSQAELRQATDAAAQHWIDTHVDLQPTQQQWDRVDIDMATLSSVVRWTWDHAAWPRRALDATHLQRLQKVLAGCSQDSFTLPGDIQCIVASEQLILRQERQPRRTK